MINCSSKIVDRFCMLYGIDYSLLICKRCSYIKIILKTIPCKMSALVIFNLFHDTITISLKHPYWKKKTRDSKCLCTSRFMFSLTIGNTCLLRITGLV